MDKRWFFGGLGFVLGGPIGVLIGLAIGTIANMAMSLDNKRIPPTLGDIKMSILILIACVIKADGKILKAEIDFIKPFLRSNYGKDAQQALYILKDLLSRNIDVKAVASQIGENVNYSTKLALFHLLVDLANADGHFHPSEKDILENIAHYILLRQNDVDSIFALYLNKSQNVNWAYQVLEIDPSVSDDEVKRAFRRMSMKYHPDKVLNGGEEMIKRANEKFDAVRRAYEQIKKIRGIK